MLCLPMQEYRHTTPPWAWRGYVTVELELGITYHDVVTVPARQQFHVVHAYPALTQTVSQLSRPAPNCGAQTIPLPWPPKPTGESHTRLCSVLFTVLGTETRTSHVGGKSSSPEPQPHLLPPCVLYSSSWFELERIQSDS